MKYTTRSTDEATFLICKGHALVNMVPMNGGQEVYFEFGPEAEKDAQAYELGALVAAKHFATTWRSLKGQINRVKSQSSIGKESMSHVSSSRS